MTFEQKSSIPLQTLERAVVTTPQPAPVLGFVFSNVHIPLTIVPFGGMRAIVSTHTKKGISEEFRISQNLKMIRKVCGFWSAAFQNLWNPQGRIASCRCLITETIDRKSIKNNANARRSLTK
jgi:hypothetical protein